MNLILENPSFMTAFRKLEGVRLNPRRHTSDNAMQHSTMVAGRAAALAATNHCSEEEEQLLSALGLAHDIGKLTGSARPERSIDVLADCGVDDPTFLSLVRWHDTSLPWYQASSKGQPPTDKAWRRLGSAVDMRLLALFMVADRADSPAGWRRNAPTVWFLTEARKRGLVGDFTFDLPGQPSEVSAGGAVVRRNQGVPEALVIRVRSVGYELPKGGVEWDELPIETAGREIREEAGVESQLLEGPELGQLDYLVGEGAGCHCKRVRYFKLEPAGPIELGPLPQRTRERCWVDLDGARTLPLISEGLRPILTAALGNADCFHAGR